VGQAPELRVLELRVPRAAEPAEELLAPPVGQARGQLERPVVELLAELPVPERALAARVGPRARRPEQVRAPAAQLVWVLARVPAPASQVEEARQVQRPAREPALQAAPAPAVQREHRAQQLERRVPPAQEPLAQRALQVPALLAVLAPVAQQEHRARQQVRAGQPAQQVQLVGVPARRARQVQPVRALQLEQAQEQRAQRARRVLELPVVQAPEARRVPRAPQ